jgi:hypothetical protein
LLSTDLSLSVCQSPEERIEGGIVKWKLARNFFADIFVRMITTAQKLLNDNASGLEISFSHEEWH